MRETPDIPAVPHRTKVGLNLRSALALHARSMHFPLEHRQNETNLLSSSLARFTSPRRAEVDHWIELLSSGIYTLPIKMKKFAKPQSPKPASAWDVLPFWRRVSAATQG